MAQFPDYKGLIRTEIDDNETWAEEVSADYDSTESLLEDLERIVFTGYAVALGTVETEYRLDHPFGFRKADFTIDVLVLAKYGKGGANTDYLRTYADNVFQLLQHNYLLDESDNPQCLDCIVENAGAVVQHNDRLRYVPLQVRVTALETAV